MNFPKQVMNKNEIKASELYKKLEDALGAVAIVSVDDNNHHIYKIPRTIQKAVVYDFKLSVGDELSLWVLRSGKVGRVDFQSNNIKKTLASITLKDDDLNLDEKELSRIIKRHIVSEERSEFKANINKRTMGKLISSVLDSSPELEQLKADLTKGSGKFVAVKDEYFYGVNGWTKKKSEIKTFSDIEEAKKVENVKKVVEI